MFLGSNIVFYLQNYIKLISKEECNMLISDIVMTNYCFINTFEFLNKHPFFRKIALKIINFIISKEIENRVWNIDSIEELLFEYIDFLDKTKVQREIFIKDQYMSIKNNDKTKFSYKARKDKSGRITFIACQFYNKNADFSVSINLNISNTIALTKLTCTLSRDGIPINYSSTSDIMKYKNDIISILRTKIMEYTESYLPYAMANIEMVMNEIKNESNIRGKQI